MKMTMTMTTLLAGLLAAGPAWAHGKLMQKELKTLDEAAAALQPSNPDLSSKLQDLAKREKAEASSKMRESSAQDEADVQILKDSANALRQSRPDLAKKLDRCAASESREAKKGTRPMRENRMSPNTQGY